MPSARLLVLLWAMGLWPALTGCSQNLAARVLPGADVGAEKTYYVVRHERDTRQIDLVVRDTMRAMGFRQVTSGLEGVMPPTVDIVVQYEDRWMWDMTNYLIMLKIQFRDRSSNTLLARGRSYRTSMVRAPVEVMVREALEAIFLPGKEA